MTVLKEPGHARHTSPLATIPPAALGRRIRGLKAEFRGGRVPLRGQTDSLGPKQFPQLVPVSVTRLPVTANEIKVVRRRERRVLLATGDGRLRHACQSRLTELGWEIATARNGLESVERFRGAGADVVVLDDELLWGGADGVLSVLAEESSPPGKVLLLGIPQRLIGASKAKVVSIVRKPVDVESLAVAVIDAMGDRATSCGNSDGRPDPDR